MLTDDDLAAIRAIVREELAHALTTPEERLRAETQRRWGAGFHRLAEMAPKRPAVPDDQAEALRELAAATIAKARGESGAAARHLRANASYRVRFDESYRKRARKTLGTALDATLTEEDMIAAMKLWAARRRRRRPPGG